MALWFVSAIVTQVIQYQPCNLIVAVVNTSVFAGFAFFFSHKRVTWLCKYEKRVSRKRKSTPSDLVADLAVDMAEHVEKLQGEYKY